VGSPATPGVTAPTVGEREGGGEETERERKICMIVLEERVKRRKPLDDCDNRTDRKLIRKLLGTSWS
jgi:hypothetical protein